MNFHLMNERKKEKISRFKDTLQCLQALTHVLSRSPRPPSKNRGPPTLPPTLLPSFSRFIR